MVTDVGSPAAHASIIAREYGIPCVVGTQVGERAHDTGRHPFGDELPGDRMRIAKIIQP